jgi:hypothetical protein
MSLDATRQDLPEKPTERLELIAYRERVALLGLWQAAWDAPSGEVVAADRGAQITVPVGMGVVVPASRIVEVFDLPVLKEKRETMKRERDLASAAVPQTTGAIRSEVTARPIPGDGSTNPPNKEDFTSLSNAAAKTKSQDDQT